MRKKRLRPELYAELRKQVLERDGWRCQQCGQTRDLHVHHIQSRGHLGSDTEGNLITLCALCHQTYHQHSGN
jgi:5-methylcytosine-specific restriction endonuclease McrA